MDLNACILQIQNYLSSTPLVVLGSGASASFGLPTMQELSATLMKNETLFYSLGDDAKSFFRLLNQGTGLETAIEITSELSSESKNLIREIIWNTVNEKDKAFFYQQLQTGFLDFPLTRLIKKLTEPAPYNANIVTTNYDRLAEYAVDIAKATAVTGFEGLYHRCVELSAKTTKARIRARERTVSIWKVHGSLDWFQSLSGDAVSFPLQNAIPQNFTPLIVPPGNEKYLSTHNEPYRTILTQSDAAIVNAQAYLTIGYGFNDTHIQPKIITEIKNGKPIVVLAKQATDACKNLFAQNNIKKYIIIEEDSQKTKVNINGQENVYDGSFWNLKDFMEVW